MTRFKSCRRSLRRFAPLVLLLLFSQALALNPVANFDTNRLMGTWYEIAAVRGFLQSRCARDTRTAYTPGENGAIATRSQCIREDGAPEINEGRARVLDPALPSVLKTTGVYFLGIWWYPFGRESIVIAVEPDYRWIVTAHPSLRYGRILSRAPALSDEALKTVADKLVKEGFDLCAFVFTPQTGGRAGSAKLCEIVR